MKVLCEMLEGSESLPEYASSGASGADLRANIKESIEIHPGERVLIPTGISCQIPEGFEIQIRPRSGLAYKHGITVLNSPGTIDADYRGEIKVLLVNLGQEVFVVESGMRIAQAVVAKVERTEFVIAEEALTETCRGLGGFGHTGVE